MKKERITSVWQLPNTSDPRQEINPTLKVRRIWGAESPAWKMRRREKITRPDTPAANQPPSGDPISFRQLNLSLVSVGQIFFFSSLSLSLSIYLSIYLSLTLTLLHLFSCQGNVQLVGRNGDTGWDVINKSILHLKHSVFCNHSFQ